MNNLPDSWRDSLTALRTALLHLHKSLLDAERQSYETQHGPIRSNGEYLQLLINHERFQWLQPYTSLVVVCDETLESKEAIAAEAVEALWTKARELTETMKADTNSRYSLILKSSPVVQMTDAEVSQLLEMHGSKS